MKKAILFIGVTQYDLTRDDSHLAKKFEGLSGAFHVFSIARGKPFRTRKWNSDFYLIPYRFLFVPCALIAGAYLCVSKKIDVVIVQSPLTEALIGVVLKTLFRKELIVEAHGDWETVPFLSRKRTFEGLLKKIAPRIGRFTLRRANKIRTLTGLFAEKIKKIAPGKKVFIFPTYTDIDYFLEEKNAYFKNYILTAATLSPIKNIEMLIESFARIHKGFPSFKLVIAGEGPSLDNYKLQTINYKLEGMVIFTGKLSASEVREVMKDCYAFVLPSLSEGFGRVFIEAMALGKPVIGSNVGGVPEIIQDGKNGFLVESRDVNALALKLEELIKDPERARNMGEAGRKFVLENFSNEKYIKNYAEMINS